MARIFGLNNTLPAEAPQGLIGTTGQPLQLPEGFTLPATKTAAISGVLSVTGSTSLFNTTITGTLQTQGNTSIGNNASQIHSITGLTTFNQLATLNSLQFAGSDNTSLSFYSAGSIEMTLTGCTSSPTVTVHYTRIGNQVILSSNSVQGVSNAASMTLSTNPLPTFLRPAATKVITHLVQDNDVFLQGRADVSAGGVITFFTTAGTGSFTNSGNKGIPGLFIAYTIA